MAEPISMVQLALAHAQSNEPHDFAARIQLLADGVSTDRLSRTELQLLPVVASALASALPHHPATPVAEGAKRRAAAEALLAGSAAVAAARALGHQGLTVAPLKGTALSDRYEALNWRRPMGDADILVLEDASWEDIDRALVTEGFTRAPGSYHARNYDLPDGRRVDIHRFVSTPNSFPQALHPCIAGLVTTEIDSSGFRHLAPEFHMAHAIEHAMRWNPIPPARSISDIAAIQASVPSLDWTCVHDLLHEWCAGINGIALVDVLVRGDVLPADAAKANAAPISVTDLWIQRLAPVDPRESWLSQSLTYFGLVPWRLHRNSKSFDYAQYLRALWSLEEGETLTSAATARVSRRLRYGRNLPQYIHD